MSAANIASLPSPALAKTKPRRKSVQPCTNTRYTYAACAHVYLVRCSAHRVDKNSGSCTCPDPRAGFVAIERSTACPSCSFAARRTEYDLDLTSLLEQQKPISTAIAQNYAARLKLPRLYFSEDHKATLNAQYIEEGEDLQEQSRQLTAGIRDAEAKIQRLQDEAAECKTWESIGTWVQCQGKRRQRLMIWFTCEEDAELWKWDMQQ